MCNWIRGLGWKNVLSYSTSANLTKVREFYNGICKVDPVHQIIESRMRGVKVSINPKVISDLLEIGPLPDSYVYPFHLGEESIDTPELRKKLS